MGRTAFVCLLSALLTGCAIQYSDAEQSTHSPEEMHAILKGKVWVSRHPNAPKTPTEAMYFGKDGVLYVCDAHLTPIAGLPAHSEHVSKWDTVHSDWTRTRVVLKEDGAGPTPMFEPATNRLYTRADDGGKRITFSDGVLQDEWPAFAVEACPDITVQVLSAKSTGR